jgi:peptidyl-prolyl cis-trans isomerase C
VSASRPRPTGGLLREPLLWFLVVGIGFFGLERLWPDSPVDGPIAVSDATVVGLVTGFAETQGRAPTDAEVDALIETHADELRSLREARGLGLDRADPVVRRRLLQKLAFLDAGALPTPDDTVLRAFLVEHPERYVRPGRTDGVAVRLPRGGDPVVALQALEAGTAPGSLGAASPHPPAWTGLSAGRVSERTDPAVGVALAELALGAWVSVPAGSAIWLVRLDARHPGGTPPLQDVRDRVLADWQADERERRLDTAREARRARWPTMRP